MALCLSFTIFFVFKLELLYIKYCFILVVQTQLTINTGVAVIPITAEDLIAQLFLIRVILFALDLSEICDCATPHPSHALGIVSCNSLDLHLGCNQPTWVCNINHLRKGMSYLQHH